MITGQAIYVSEFFFSTPCLNEGFGIHTSGKQKTVSIFFWRGEQVAAENINAG